MKVFDAILFYALVSARAWYIGVVRIILIIIFKQTIKASAHCILLIKII